LVVIASWIILAAMGVSFSDVFQTDTYTPDSAPLVPVSAQIVPGVVWFIYEVLMLVTLGATVGKLVLGMRVIQADEEPLGIGRALLRTVVKVVILSFCHILMLVVAFQSEKRGIHDFAGGTAVVYKV